MRAGKYHKIWCVLTSERIFFPYFFRPSRVVSHRRRAAIRLRRSFEKSAYFESNSRCSLTVSGVVSPDGVAEMSNARISVPLIETSPM
jgi:hypothetical protein